MSFFEKYLSMKNRSFFFKFLIFFFCVVFLTIFCFELFKPKKIRIIAFNDFHGMLESSNEVGAARFANAVKRESRGVKAIVVSGGDNFIGEGLSNLFYGKPVAEIFKSINLFTSVIGNHEFDWGVDKIYDWEKQSGAKFISANIKYKDGNYLTTPYVIKKINGKKVGFIGLTTLETLFKTSKKNIENLEFLDPVEVVAEVVAELKKQNVDIIILLTHIATFQDSETGEITFETTELEELAKIDGVDVVITGHSHEQVMGFVNGVPVVQSLHRGRILTIIDFNFGIFNGKVAEIVVHQRNLLEEKDKLKPDKKILKILKTYDDKAPLILNAPLMTLDTTLEHYKNGLSPLGSFMTQALNNQTGSDFTVINGGIFRNGLNSGVVNLEHIYEMMPFEGYGVKIKMSGAGLKKLVLDSPDKNMQYYGFTIQDGKIILNDGKEIDDNESYKVLVNDFMLEGGDGYTFIDYEIVEVLENIRDIFIKSI